MPELTLEQRVAALEQQMAALSRNGSAQPPAGGARWWERMGPQFKNDSVFEEMLAYGRYFRKTGRDAPPDWKPGDPIPEANEDGAP